jgi:hypothetical protein
MVSNFFLDAIVAFHIEILDIKVQQGKWENIFDKICFLLSIYIYEFFNNRNKQQLHEDKFQTSSSPERLSLKLGLHGKM